MNKDKMNAITENDCWITKLNVKPIAEKSQGVIIIQ